MDHPTMICNIPHRALVITQHPPHIARTALIRQSHIQRRAIEILRFPQRVMHLGQKWEARGGMVTIY
jgi:hypothetical protein